MCVCVCVSCDIKQKRLSSGREIQVSVPPPGLIYRNSPSTSTLTHWASSAGDSLASTRIHARSLMLTQTHTQTGLSQLRVHVVEPHMPYDLSK